MNCHGCGEFVRQTPVRKDGKIVKDIDDCWIQTFPHKRIWHHACRVTVRRNDGRPAQDNSDE